MFSAKLGFPLSVAFRLVLLLQRHIRIGERRINKTGDRESLADLLSQWSDIRPPILYHGYVLIPCALTNNIEYIQTNYFAVSTPNVMFIL